MLLREKETAGVTCLRSQVTHSGQGWTQPLIPIVELDSQYCVMFLLSSVCPTLDIEAGGDMVEVIGSDSGSRESDS